MNDPSARVGVGRLYVVGDGADRLKASERA